MSGNPHLNDSDKASAGPLGPPIKPATRPAPEPPWRQSPVHPDYLRRVNADGMVEIKRKDSP